MAQKIILFLSTYKDTAAENAYSCPTGGTVYGTQTNDAPVRYLLRENPLIRDILCIVTDSACADALEHFEKVVRNASSRASVSPVYFEEEQDFSQTVIPRILSEVKSDDEIFLDITGGFRNANMHLLLLSRILSYCGIHVSGAVYSNFNTHTIEDVAHLFSLFDLVNGMQELTNLGSVRTLRNYYGEHPENPAIDELLTATEKLTEAIVLCRAQQIKPLMANFAEAIENASNCTDPLMRQLVSAFRRTFGKKLATPGLIRWCLKNDMLQQALTVYTELIPSFIFEHGILTADHTVRKPFAQSYEDPSAVLFLRGFLKLSERYPNRIASDLPTQLKTYVKEHTNEILSLAQGKSGIKPPAPLATGIENIALLAKLAYLDNGGIFNEQWANSLPDNKKGLSMLREQINIMPASTVQGMLNSVNIYPRSQMYLLLETEETTFNSYVLTLRNLDKLLPNSGYKTKLSPERLAEIARDYLYIKTLRNLTNHANDDITSEQTDLINYLLEYNYEHPRNTTLTYIKDVITRSLKHLNE